MSAHPLRSRGFTLLELMVSMTIVLLGLGIATASFIDQNKSLQALDMAREANESTRDAMLQLESSLRVAGWGVDPRHAIDMQYQCAGAGTACRVSISGPDQLAFVARNPAYRWLAPGEVTPDGASCPDTVTGGCYAGNAWPIQAVDTAASPKTVTVTLPTGTVLERGRVVLATCESGQKPVMLTLSERYEGDGTQVELVPAAPASPALPYNDPDKLEGCHLNGGLFMVDRSRYLVQDVTVAGRTTPWLMLDTGLDLNDDDAIDAKDYVPIARNVVDLQVAYILQPVAGETAPDSDTDWIVGNERGAALEGLDLTKDAPDYESTNDSPARRTLHPANVRGVRVSLTLRSSRSDARMPQDWAGDALPGFENRNGTVSVAGHRLYTVQTEITLRNMDSRSPFTF